MCIGHPLLFLFSSSLLVLIVVVDNGVDSVDKVAISCGTCKLTVISFNMFCPVLPVFNRCSPGSFVRGETMLKTSVFSTLFQGDIWSFFRGVFAAARVGIRHILLEL